MQNRVGKSWRKRGENVEKSEVAWFSIDRKTI